MTTKKPKNWLEQRLTILTEIMNSDIENDWTVRRVGEAMRAHPLIKQFQPNYGKSTAARDLAMIKDELSKRRTELAEGYIATQLNITEELVDELLDELEELDNTEEYLAPDKKARAKATLVNSINSLFRRQASILPIDIPKQIQVGHEHKIDLEGFLEARQRAYAELDDPTIVDGDYEVV